MKKSGLLLFAMITFLSSRSQILAPVGNGIPSSYGIYSGAVSFEGKIYAADNAHIYRWEGTNWTDMGVTVDYAIICMQVYAGELYVAGWFTLFNGVPVNRIVKYDGTSWTPVSDGILVHDYETGGVEKMTVYNGDLIALGGFFQAGDIPANKIAKWDGVTWSALGNGFPGSQLASIPTMVVFDSNLYVFSMLDTAGEVPVRNAAKWDGTSWSALGEGINNWPVSSVVYDNAVYVGLWVSDSSSMIEKWDGMSWTNVEPPSSNTSWNIVMDMASYNGCLYITGLIDTISGTPVKNVARYDGSAWHSTDNGIDGLGEFFVEFDSSLYLTGDFVTAGPDTVDNVVKFVSPPFCLPADIKENIEEVSLSVYPNPTSGLLYIQAEDELNSLEIINTVGTTVYRSEVNSKVTNINLSEIASGIYFIKLNNRKGNLIVKKIIKQ